MVWSPRLPWSRKNATMAAESETPHVDSWDRHLAGLKAHGITEPGTAHDLKRKPATLTDEQRLYDVAPSFVDMLPWAEYLTDSRSMLLEDGESVAAFFELTPIGKEIRRTQAWGYQSLITCSAETIVLPYTVTGSVRSPS